MTRPLSVILLLLPVLLWSEAKADTYYFSSTTGDDNRTPLEAQNPLTPWQSINRLNDYFGNIQPGDSILFMRGDVFYGSIKIDRDGAPGAPIVLGAYGSGPNPVITGLTALTGWTSIGPNRWESAAEPLARQRVNILVIDSLSYPMGRYPDASAPNNGLLNYESHVDYHLIVDQELSPVPDWTGAELVVKKSSWILDKGPVLSHSGDTLVFANSLPVECVDGMSYFIQNDIRTLTEETEWYYDSASKKITLYAATAPTGVSIATLDTLINFNFTSHISVENLDFRGANRALLDCRATQHISIRNCSMNFAGTEAVFGADLDHFIIEGCTIRHSNNHGILLQFNTGDVIVRNNTVFNAGVHPGMTDQQNGFSASGIHVYGEDILIEGNRVQHTGFNGINFAEGNNIIVRKNFVEDWCMVKTDGGAIYTWRSESDTNTVMNRVIEDNICVNSSLLGNIGTALEFITPQTYGIYVDGYSENVTIRRNTVANVLTSGIRMNTPRNITIEGNTVYNCQYAQLSIDYFEQRPGGPHNVTWHNNILVAKADTQRCHYYISPVDDISFNTSADSNFYARPVADSNHISRVIYTTYCNNQPCVETFHSLDAWQAAYPGRDQHSRRSPLDITTEDDLRFEYNDTPLERIVSLGQNYIDVRGNLYPGTITLAPFTSAVLIKNGDTANLAPVAYAGPDQLITLPVSSTVLDGSGSADPDGFIVTHSWIKLSGPIEGMLVNPGMAMTPVTGLVEGLYTFELTVTDDKGAIARDTVLTTVDPFAGNTPPVADAGMDHVIMLPTDSVILDGSASNDPDGTIQVYTWIKIAGPVAGISADPSAALNTVSGMTEGLYLFELTVIDNQGSLDKDTVMVTVNPAPNQPPFADAGFDQVITLPEDSVLLDGNLSFDPDGFINNLTWTKISGPLPGTITTPGAYSTLVTGLAAGVYEFELSVTDNDGAIDTDTVVVTVNPAPNVPPTADAGIDQSITLPTSSTTLDGSASSDPDGTITVYAWIQISGPGSGTITTPSSVSTTVTGMAVGVYEFELTVTDNDGAIDKDTVVVTVNPAPNVPPTADAGIDQSITLPTNSTTLDGSASFDPDGSITGYAWVQISGPGSGTITSPSSVSTTVTGLVVGVYEFELTITDNDGAIDKDTVVVTVNPAPNVPPVADAGLDQVITLPTNSTTLDGSASSDPDGTITAYVWAQISGPGAGTITSPTSVSTTVTGMAVGIYEFELTVTDNDGAIDKDTVVVTVNPAPNVPPTANAGVDQSITLPTNSTTLDGSASSDPDGTITGYAWVQISGPGGGTITSPASVTTTITGLVVGIYEFELTVTDNDGAIDKDTVVVTVNPAPNVPPTANAGVDQSITLPTNSTTLDGSASSDPNGTITAYAWVQISGPGSGTITSPSSVSTTVTALVVGVYEFELTVTDNDGTIDKDTVVVTVNPAPNVPPTANAGADQSITLPTNSTTLDGSASSDPDGTITGYAWAQISGPGAGTITSPSSVSTTVTGMAVGIYEFELTVTDNDGAIDKDTVVVTVNPAPNVPPTANAGVDQSITLPTNSTTLDGSASSDPDGTITGYAWAHISGPGAGTITTPSSVSTTVTVLVVGVYEFELTVTDNDGAIDKDTVVITVNPAPNVPPTANAGVDQSITLPTNSTTLEGSASSDPDGTITGYAWAQISGPGAGTITTPSSVSTTVTVLVVGVYEFELTVTDNDGAIDKDTVVITVNPAPNVPPTANAGVDQSITLPTNSTTLDGSASSDPDGTITGYVWAQISGPGSGTITSPSSVTTTITGLVVGIYEFELTVTDNDGAIDKDTVVVTVNPAPNVPPIADAGPDQVITLPTNSTTLDGSASTDPDGTITGFAWAQISGPGAGTITSPASVTTTITGLVVGIYEFELTVTDNDGAIDKDTVVVTVNPAPNVPPVADAGLDQVITLPTNSTTLDGSASSDPDGTITGYGWVQISGPGAGTITSPSSVSTTVTGMAVGIYEFELTVTDNDGAIDKDTVVVTVNPAPNVPPTANAGIDQTITLPTNSTTLDGSASSDPDGTITGYAWVQISGPGAGTITSSSSVSTTVTGMVVGVYEFELTVTDNDGAIDKDTVAVTVNPAPNVPPTANAGLDQVITLPTNNTTLDGSASSDPDGTITGYAWVQISGPGFGTITTPSSVSTTVTALVVGVYEFELTVTDNDGAIDKDTVVVTVNPAPNVPPIADAGPDQVITLPTNSTILDGSASSDPDGTITGYAWAQISGPGSGTITTPSSVSTTVTGLVVGVYEFELTITDNDGAIDKDTVVVTVNPAPNVPPVANAGLDQTITLPTNNTTLDGSSSSDQDGTITAYAWVQISGPGVGTITSPASVTTTVTGLVVGVYEFELTVTDNDGAIDKDTVVVTVNPAPNVPPTANAGVDQSITLPTNSTTLDGSASFDPDGSITGYAWIQISGPGSGTITTPSSVSTTVTGMVVGVYEFELTVTDNDGAIDKDTVVVTVNPAPNVPPTADAGVDQSITLPTNSTTLDGSASTDPDGTITAYAWVQISGPGAGTVTSPASVTTTVNGLVVGIYEFELTVTDNDGAIDKDTVVVTVNPAPNVPPTADAGVDQSITLPTNSTTLDGSASSDPDGMITGYAWVQISGPGAGTITSPSSVSTTVTALVVGVYEFELTVTDNDGAIDKDTVVVTVNPAPNVPPTANAGVDQSITLPNNSTTLDGSASSDPDGTITGYVWVQISGPGAGTITSPASVTTTVNGLVVGIYEFELTVTDNDGAIDKDTVVVTVNPAPNVPPTANAGIDQTITLPTNSTTLDGSASSDPDGTITSYAWAQISGPGGGTITSPASVTTTITGLVVGIYEFELTVTDNDGAIDKDTVVITVNPAPNVPPTANAGVDQSITLPTNSTTLDGSASSDPDGTVTGYVWVQISGPGAGTVTSPASVTTTVNGLVVGIYEFELTVTDNDGAIDKDTVVVTVNPAPNVPPTADAGVDQSITLPINSTTLDGSSSSDPDGTVTGYAWVQISGPGAGTVTSPASVTTTVNGLVVGIYEFELTVTDNDGAIDKDTVVVTVNPAPNVPPIADAGLDQVITLPTNNTTLDGSASTDPDGTITAYAWVQISGPGSGTITSPSSVSTTVTALVVGVYEFELTVTDNDGAIDKDTVVVTVNPAPNVPPIADAGLDQVITLPTNSTTLDGSASSDPDGSITGYAWIQISGPGTGTITTPSSVSTTVTGLVVGVYEFELTVTDNDGAIDKDTVVVTVNPAPNVPPIADAGLDQVITLPTNNTTLDGSASTDPDGTITAYAWVQISGPGSGTITSPSSVSTTVTALVVGVYEFELTVTDNDGAIDKDTVVVTVNPAPNVPPVADAGLDQVITLPTNSTTLDGSASSDPDGTITAYVWAQISGPGAGTITSPSSVSTTVTGMAVGVYEFELTVTDNDGAIDKDTVEVTVNPAPNVPPTANAGVDQSITLPTNSTTLDGSASSDPDGTITGYAWVQISGPGGGTITSPASVTTTITGLVVGIYEFELTVTDNDGAIDKDTVVITVNPAPNVPPTANAGVDQSITLPTNSTTLDGSASSDPDGTITAYAWVQISGPGSGTITSPSSVSTTVTALVVGVYEFELTVTDNDGTIDKDTVVVTVNPAPNVPPTANAGVDQSITLPTNSTTLDGSASSDPDGTITGYAWAQISGPGSGTITTPSSVSTTVTGFVVGVYEFELIVTDNDGAIDKDTVVVTVNPAPNVPPTANAGLDQVITLPTNSTTLDGSASSDPDGTITGYAWVQISGPGAGTVTSPASVTTTVNGLVVGIYEFELTVTDNDGAIDKDTVVVTVNPAPNVQPTANAGLDQVITLPTNNTTLDGSASSDPDGTITGYAWVQISGPGAGTITTPSSVSTTVTALVVGVYEFELTVTDNDGAIDKDTVVVTVNPAPNVPPTANAGVDQSITLPTNSTTLDGSASSDPDGTITGYAWAQISGPGAGTITSPASVTTTVTGMVVGVYEFELTVTDNDGAIDKDTVVVTVNPAPNVPPTANAGLDQVITLPTNNTTLDGSASSDPDGTITAYAWVQISGPGAGTVTSPASVTTTVNGLVVGIYEFELTVTDNDGAIDKDTVVVTVNPAPNVPPTANAGADQSITLPTNSTTLDGSASSDPDGTITGYAWVKISGPADGTLSNATSATTAVTGMIAGVYVYELTVTDNNGATGKDTVRVTVNPAPNQPPTADAGPDQIITLPLNNTTLDGSASSDPDGSITGYVWVKLTGPASGSVSSPSMMMSPVTGLAAGIYTFELTVMDNSGAQDRDTVTIEVKEAEKPVVRLFPNPATTSINLEFPAAVEPVPATVTIRDSRGALVHREKFMREGPSMIRQINISRLAGGYYIIEITGVDTKPIIIRFIRQ